jgi:predicted phage terminase large subunit-like protein
MMIDKKEISKQAKLELARREFFYFCHLMAKDFYKRDRAYLKEICDDLQSFYEDPEEEILVMNLPPRHGKSRTVSLFTDWVFGENQNEKVMTGSYNETLSTTFSKNVRDPILEVKADKDKIVYSDIFPNVKIKRGDGAMNLWSLEGGYNNYLATSPTGTSTGFGCTLMIIDDLIKSALEAHNSQVLDKHWDWFVNTMLSRLEENGKIIIIMTRWANNDLAGRALKHFREEGKKIRHVVMKAHLGGGKMLCPEILSYRSYKSKKRAMGADIASANYQQEPIDIKGKLYSSFKTYTSLPVDENGNSLFTGIYSYCDTADQGDDYLCDITFGVFNKEAYVLDVYYTKEPMEITEPETAKRLHENDVGLAYIESNNGGRGFSRQVDRHLKEDHKSNRTKIKWFHQSQNKKARILSNATWVMDHIYFPVNWKDKWPDYYESMNTYQREGKNAHDDACLVANTMVSTLTGLKPIQNVKKGDYVFTPYGLRKVLWSGCTGEKEVIHKSNLTGTPDHKVFSKRAGFIPLDAFTGTTENDIISLGGLIKWKYKRLLYSTEKNTNLWGRESIILASQTPIKEEKVLRDFMWRFGKTITEKKFLKAVIFTIKTATLLTTTFATWSVYQAGNMHKSTSIKRIQNLKNFKKQEEKPQKSGTEAKKVGNGTQNTRKESPITSSPSKPHAKSAEESLKRKEILHNSAQTNAVKHGEVNTRDLSIQRIAPFAEKNLQQQNVNHLPLGERHVQKRAQTFLTTKIEKQKVYNLTIEKDHVYYADGLLVSNCDATTGVAEIINNKISTRKRNHSGKGAR